MEIIYAKTDHDIYEIKKLFEEYADQLSFDLEFQKFQDELKGLPGEYSEPKGALLLGKEKGNLVGCIALRPLDTRICEMKRLYIRPAFRNRGYGRLLAERIITEANKKGYKYMRLDTVSSMKEAISLYQSMGFRDIPPYRYNPIDGARYFQLNLD